MAAGEAFSRDQKLRLDRAVAAASGQTGITFAVRLGPLGGSAEEVAEHTLASLAGPDDMAAVVLVSPEERVVQIATTRAARTRLSDHACALATLSMTTSFGVGDLVGGVVNGLRMLADAAGRQVVGPAPATPTPPARVDETPPPALPARTAEQEAAPRG